MIKFLIIWIITSLWYWLDLVLFLRQQSIVIACLKINQAQILAESRLCKISTVVVILSHLWRIYLDSSGFPSIFSIFARSSCTIVVIILYRDYVNVDLWLIVYD